MLLDFVTWNFVTWDFLFVEFGISQFCFWLEPALGLDLDPVRAQVSDILNGKTLTERIKVVVATKGPLAPLTDLVRMGGRRGSR